MNTEFRGSALRKPYTQANHVSSCWVFSEVYLKAGVAAEVEQRLHHLQVTLVYRDMQRRLSALVPGVEVGSTSVQNLDD